MSMKNSNDTIGNGTRDLPACRAVPKPTAPPRAHLKTVVTKSKELFAPPPEQIKLQHHIRQWQNIHVTYTQIIGLNTRWLFKHIVY